MGRKKILLINTQFVELYISGFTNRFIGLWCYLQKNSKEDASVPEVHWLTNYSLWKKYFGNTEPPPGVTIIKANLGLFKYTSRLFYPFYILYTYYRYRCSSVHIATSIIKSIYLLRLFNFFNIPYCITFASNSVEMAAYKSDAMRNHWKKVFEIAKNVDVLNPTNTIVTRGKKFISPNSFPYIIEFNNIPAEKFTNTYRENSIIFCGSFVQQKNPLLAIEGFAAFLEKYSDSYPDARLLMFGKGNLLPVVMEKLESVNMKFEREAISIIPDTKLIDSLSISKIFLSLQDYDNYPSQSVMEAMLFGQSVLSIDNGDTWKLVQPSLDNVLIKEKDPIAVGEGIQHLLSTWQFNIQNRQLILNEFSPEKYARYFFDIHTSIS